MPFGQKEQEAVIWIEHEAIAQGDESMRGYATRAAYQAIANGEWDGKYKIYLQSIEQ